MNNIKEPEELSLEETIKTMLQSKKRLLKLSELAEYTKKELIAFRVIDMAIKGNMNAIVWLAKITNEVDTSKMTDPEKEVFCKQIQKRFHSIAERTR